MPVQTIFPLFIASVLFLCFLAYPRKGVVFLILALPFPLALNPFPGVDLTFLRLAVPLLAGAALLRLDGGVLAVARHPLVLLWALFLAAAALSLLLAPEAGQGGLRKFIYLFSFSPMLLVLPSLMGRPPNPYWLRPLLVAGAVSALLGLVQFAAQFFVSLERLFGFFSSLAPYLHGQEFGALVTRHPSWFVEIAGEPWLRAFALFPDPHLLAFWLSFLSSIALALFFNAAPKTRGRFVYAALWLLFTLGVFLTFSRGGYLGWLAGSAMVALARWRLVDRPARIFWLTALGTILALLWAGPFGSRFSSSFDFTEGSSLERLDLWRHAAGQVIAEPFGAGLGQFALALDPHSGLRSPASAHNLYLDVGVETGLGGLAALAGFFAVALAIFWRTRAEALSLGFAGGLAAFLVHSLFENLLWFPPLLLLLLLAGAVAVRMRL